MFSSFVLVCDNRRYKRFLFWSHLTSLYCYVRLMALFHGLVEIKRFPSDKSTANSLKLSGSSAWG